MKGSYSVVKFVPDSVRFEPINVGIVVEVGDHLTTKMAEDVDPRVRLADPYADLPSLRDFLDSFDASNYDEIAGSHGIVAWLHSNGLPNIFFSAPREIEVEPARLDDLVESLHARLVARSFARPPESVRAPGTSAARTALREAFRTAGVLKKQVESEIELQGASGTKWRIDFRYLTDAGVALVQTATTSLHEELRGKEHGYEAFVALLDTTKRTPAEKDEVEAAPSRGILAVDARPEENEISAGLALVSKAHGFEFVAGQRGFFKLATEVQRRGLSVNGKEDRKEPAGSLWTR